jgi:hypothetical protein
VFGNNIDLTGESVSVQFLIDTSLGTRTEADSQLQYIGGFFYPVQTSPVTSGTITVDGVTHVVDFPAFGSLLESIPPGVLGDDIEAQVSQLSENQTGPVLHFDSISAFSQSNSNGQLTPNGFDMPFSYAPTEALSDKEPAVRLAVVASDHEQSVPIFQQLAGGHPSGRDDVREIPAVASKRRRSLGRARDRHQPRDRPVLVEPVWPDVRRRDP